MGASPYGHRFCVPSNAWLDFQPIGDLRENKVTFADQRREWKLALCRPDIQQFDAALRHLHVMESIFGLIASAIN